MSETKSRITHAIPVLPAQNVAETIAFYRDKLGFAVVDDYGNYALFERDGVELHVWLCEDRTIAENTSCHLRVEGIEAIYAEYQAQNIIHPNGALEMKPWGLRQFTVLDNSGNCLHISEE